MNCRPKDDCRIYQYEDLPAESDTANSNRDELRPVITQPQHKAPFPCDATEPWRAEEALRDADRRSGEFLAMLAHELRNPLAPICNSLQILRLTENLPPAVQEVSAIIDRQVRHLVRLVDDLLDLSRIATGTIELRKQQVELDALVADAVEASRPWIDAAHHRLSVSVPAEPLILDADPSRLAQVIANLLNHAAAHTNDGGEICLTVSRDREEAVVSVRDNGLGIPQDLLPRVFELFPQAEHMFNRTQGGLGIELALSKSLVELHGGRIEAHSGGAGQGSEFVVHLPIAPEGIRSPVTRTSSGTGRASVATRRILIVDDNRLAGHVLGKLLEKLGQQVRSTDGAASALEAVRVERPDVVIGDIGMPTVDGYELARRLRRDPALQGIVLVALTGFGQDSDRQRAKEAGFDHYLVKPVSLEALEELLASLPDLA